MSASQPNVDFDPSLDARQIASIFARAGRVHIDRFLTNDSAIAAHRSLAEEVPWQLHLNDGDRSFDVARDQVSSLPSATQVLLYERVIDNAVSGFQYLYENFPLSDAHALGRQRDLYAMRVFEFLNSPRFLDFVRTITAEPAITLADAQATLYRPGHFLTQHNDSAAGAERVAAYVLNLTPQWRADWGGILHFIDKDGHVAEGYTPSFNALNLFKVPQPHAVSYVAPFAKAGRYSITGWLRKS